MRTAVDFLTELAQRAHSEAVDAQWWLALGGMMAEGWTIVAPEDAAALDEPAEPAPFTPRDEARTCVPHGERDCPLCSPSSTLEAQVVRVLRAASGRPPRVLARLLIESAQQWAGLDEIPRGSGVAPFGKLMPVGDFAKLLRDISNLVLSGDSFEGSLAYEMDPVGAADLPDRWVAVQASYRTGNSMGQGGVVLVRSDMGEVGEAT